MLTGDPQHNLFLLPTPDFEKLHRAFLDHFQQVLQGKEEAKAALDQVAALFQPGNRRSEEVTPGYILASGDAGRASGLSRAALVSTTRSNVQE